MIITRDTIVDFPSAMVFQPIALVIILHCNYALATVPVRRQILVLVMWATLLTTAPFKLALALWLMKQVPYAVVMVFALLPTIVPALVDTQCPTVQYLYAMV